MADKNKYQLSGGTLVFDGRTIATVGPIELGFNAEVDTFDDASDANGRIGSCAKKRDMAIRFSVGEINADNFQLASGYFGNTEGVGSATRVYFNDSDRDLANGEMTLSGLLLDGTPVKVWFKDGTADPSGSWPWDKGNRSKFDVTISKNVNSDGTDISGWAEFGDAT